eukprot:3890120-Rhodomonas_salina.1
MQQQQGLGRQPQRTHVAPVFGTRMDGARKQFVSAPQLLQTAQSAKVRCFADFNNDRLPHNLRDVSPDSVIVLVLLCHNSTQRFCQVHFIGTDHQSLYPQHATIGP